MSATIGYAKKIEQLIEQRDSLRAAIARATAQADRALLVNEQNLREELAALKASLGEPVYQLKLSDGTWIDQTANSYRYNQKEFSKDTRILYALTNKDQS